MHYLSVHVVLLLLIPVHHIHSQVNPGYEVSKRLVMHLPKLWNLGKWFKENSKHCLQFFLRISWVQKPEKTSHWWSLQFQTKNQKEKYWPQESGRRKWHQECQESASRGYLHWAKWLPQDDLAEFPWMNFIINNFDFILSASFWECWNNCQTQVQAKWNIQGIDFVLQMILHFSNLKVFLITMYNFLYISPDWLISHFLSIKQYITIAKSNDNKATEGLQIITCSLTLTNIAGGMISISRSFGQLLLEQLIQQLLWEQLFQQWLQEQKFCWRLLQHILLEQLFQQ